MDEQARGPGQFDLVIEVNEGTKQMRQLSTEVGMRALDAVIRSRKSGDELAGFGEVSSQMRRWAETLDQQVEALNTGSRTAVERVSALVKRRRFLALMEGAAATEAARACLVDVNAAARRTIAEEDRALESLWRALSAAVGDLAQLGVMACALSRSAMIEAEYGRPEDRDALLEVAGGFSQRSDEVVVINKALKKKLMRRGT